MFDAEAWDRAHELVAAVRDPPVAVDIRLAELYRHVDPGPEREAGRLIVRAQGLHLPEVARGQLHLWRRTITGAYMGWVTYELPGPISLPALHAAHFVPRTLLRPVVE
ncbi:hypothetical protein [Crossiella sp. CA198]|uniref:hypothetical protein n=1 Tax=Crossiella sp. CA198 TaxID=3455607 RepID=UPI003F8D42B5